MDTLLSRTEHGGYCRHNKTFAYTSQSTWCLLRSRRTWTLAPAGKWEVTKNLLYSPSETHLSPVRPFQIAQSQVPHLCLFPPAALQHGLGELQMVGPCYLELCWAELHYPPTGKMAIQHRSARRPVVRWEVGVLDGHPFSSPFFSGGRFCPTFQKVRSVVSQVVI